MRKYIRQYELVIGEPYSITKDEVANIPEIPFKSKVKPLEDAVLKANKEKEGVNGYLISDLHIEFNVTKTKSGLSANTAFVTIYNMSDTMVNYLENKSGKKVVVLLKTGYQGSELKNVFIGNLERFEDVFDKQTRKTKLFITDGGANLQETTTSRYYPKGTSLDSIIGDLVSDTLLPKSGGNVYKTNITTAKPWYFSGNVVRELLKVGNYYQYSFSVQDGACYWTPAGKAADVMATVVSPDTGLIGQVTALDSTQGISQNSLSDNNPGVRFKVLMDGNLIPESVVVLDTSTKSGSYKITKVTHKGSYEGSIWYSEVEAEEVVLL